MPELMYPTSVELGGPLFISAKALKELDSVLADQLPKLRAAQEKLVPSKVEERLARSVWALGDKPTEERIERMRLEYAEDAKREYLEGYSTKVTVQFSNGSRLEASSFDEASGHPEILHNVPTGFDLKIEAGSVSARLYTSTYDPDLTISVSPTGYDPAGYFFTALRGWARSVAAPRWQRWWVKVRWIMPMLWALWLVAVLTVWAGWNDMAAKGYYKDQAHKILKDGVNAGNQQKALETILALQSEYSPSTPLQPPGRRFWFFAAGSFLMCLILSFPPKIEIGIGRGEERIAAWHRWLKIVFVFVPGFIASNFVWPIVIQAIKRATQ